MSGELGNLFSVSNSCSNRAGISVVVEDVVDATKAHTDQTKDNGRNQPVSEFKTLRRNPDTIRLTRFPTQLHNMQPLSASTNSIDTETDASITHVNMDHQYLQDMCTRKSICEKARMSACCGSSKSRCRLVTNRVQPLESVNQKTLSIRQHAHWDEHTLFSQLKFDDYDSLIEAVTRAPSVITLRDSHGQTLLHHAASKGNLKIAKFLINHKSKINDVDEQGNLPIHAAVKEGHAQITKYLLTAGADALHANKDGLQPIHIVCERNDVSTLKLNHGANIYMRDFEKTYPIHVAIANISHQCVKALFEHEERYYSHKLEQTRMEDGLRVPSIPSSRFSSISEVCNTHSSSDSGKIDKRRRVSKTLRKLEHLAQSLRRYSQQNMDEEQCLITLTDCEGETPLHAAVTSGSTEMVKICLDRNAKVLAKQNDENTPVHYACIKDDLECVQLLFNAKPELRSTVLRMPNKNGYTPLHLAAVYNHEKMICYLVEQGSPLEMTDRNGWTPLLLAAIKGAFQACVQLLRLGANPNAHDLTNRNLVHLLMLFRGPGVRTVLPEMNNNELFKRLVNEKDNYGSTPLHYSTQMGNLGATQAFLLQGASALERDNERNTPLHTAAYFGRLHTCERLLDTGHGMRAMNSPDALGRLPLHVAVEQGHVNVVKLFLEKGCVFRKQTYGKWIQLCVTMYYAILLAAITSLVLSHSPIRHVETLDKLIPCADLFHRTPTHLLVFSTMAVVVLILTGLDLAIKIWQLITQDILELSMEEREQANFCFSAHQEFLSVLQSNVTTGEVAMELQPFQYMGLSMFKTLMMMLGEYEHTATLIAPLTGNSPVSVHYPAITLFFYVAFVFLVPIILMNLLIGLAVGDIEQVRQTAVQRLISQQVYWLADLEPKLMIIFRSKVYNHSWKRKWRKDRTVATPSEGTTEVESSQDESLRSDLKEALHMLVFSCVSRKRCANSFFPLKKLGIVRDYVKLSVHKYASGSDLI
ncbi:transient receptor potential cation channel subfamily A member 1 [Paragonimus westermani]|uniref:Transient receptor potential cation channel subfamily A member 1 n=1 Tax=Paragonimus westermani TaxID=34504 RepID=A0A5J4NYL6_9TREM|nr:transient receptor potential cation channel subfamily A member 1 [Paragonimus westermani]